MTNQILTYIAVAVSIIGIIISYFSLMRKRKAEKTYEELLKSKMSELVMLEKLGEKSKEIENKRLLTQIELKELQEKLKRLLSEIDKKYQEDILESLEQKSQKGQIDYLNKLIHLSGSTENVEIKKED